MKMPASAREGTSARKNTHQLSTDVWKQSSKKFGRGCQERIENVSLGHGVSLLRWRSGGVEHPHDTPPYPSMPSPTFGLSSAWFPHMPAITTRKGLGGDHHGQEGNESSASQTLNLHSPRCPKAFR